MWLALVVVHAELLSPFLLLNTLSLSAVVDMVEHIKDDGAVRVGFAQVAFSVHLIKHQFPIEGLDVVGGVIEQRDE